MAGSTETKKKFTEAKDQAKAQEEALYRQQASAAFQHYLSQHENAKLTVEEEQIIRRRAQQMESFRARYIREHEIDPSTNKLRSDMIAELAAHLDGGQGGTLTTGPILVKFSEQLYHLIRAFGMSVLPLPAEQLAKGSVIIEKVLNQIKQTIGNLRGKKECPEISYSVDINQSNKLDVKAFYPDKTPFEGEAKQLFETGVRRWAEAQGYQYRNEKLVNAQGKEMTQEKFEELNQDEETGLTHYLQELFPIKAQFELCKSSEPTSTLRP